MLFVSWALDRRPYGDTKLLSIAYYIAMSDSKLSPLRLKVLPSYIFKLMQEVEQFSSKSKVKLTGQQKKERVIAALQVLIPGDSVLEALIPSFIDLLVSVDGNKIRLKRPCQSTCGCFGI